MIYSAKQKAEYQVNSTIIELYWGIGEYVSKQTEMNGWGRLIESKVIDETEEFVAMLRYYNIPYVEIDGTYIIYGYRSSNFDYMV